MIEKNKIYNTDCLQLMRQIPNKSIDMILCDLPYGTTKNKWDSPIDLKILWEQYLRIVKNRSAIVLTASQPFTSKLIQSNYKMFKHEWIWKKNRGSNFATLKTNPFKEHESILVFCNGKNRYYPIMEKRSDSGKSRLGYKFKNRGEDEINGGKFINNGKSEYINPNGKERRNPSSVQNFNTEVGLHPTQKPVTLFEYLVKTYSIEGDVILDNCIGSGTTAIACINTNRNFIGIELDKEYYQIALNRIKKRQLVTEGGTK